MDHENSSGAGTRAMALLEALGGATLLGFGPAGAKAAFVGIAQSNTPYIVTSNADDGTEGTLRFGIISGADGRIITFDPSLAGTTVTLTSGPLFISQGITIDGGSGVTIDGNNQSTVFSVNADDGDTVTLKNLTIANGRGQGTGPFFEPDGSSGGNTAGGIYASRGNLALENATFSDNTATGGNGSRAGTNPLSMNYKGAGSGGSAAGAVYIEPAVQVVQASNLVFVGDTNTALAGQGGAGDEMSAAGRPGTADDNTNNEAVRAAAVCFASGTRILTVRGEIAVEDLAVGDLAVTASGTHRPIRWLGHRTTDCRNHPAHRNVLPVRIAAAAFGEGRPARDLVVSPGHSLCFDLLGEVLIPASSLVNGTTITQEEVETVTYWHVELDSHDILIAEGQPAESYLEMGNRGFFAEAGVVSLGATPDGPVPGHADFCRPFHDGGIVVEAVREQLRTRAKALGWGLDGDDAWAGAHLMVDGVRVEATRRGLTARFVVPADAQEVWLVSRTSVPHHVGLGADPRSLGLYLSGLSIGDGLSEARTVALDDPRLCVGFHAAEGEAGQARRWTAESARLPQSLWAECRDVFFLRIDLGRPALPRWVAPQAASPVVAANDREAPYRVRLAG